MINSVLPSLILPGNHLFKVPSDLIKLASSSTKSLILDLDIPNPFLAYS